MKLREVTSGGKPYYFFTRLTVGYHQVHRLRSVKNKFGKNVGATSKSILVELNDQVFFCRNISGKR